MSGLPASDNAVADAAGKAVVRLQPLRAFETWEIKNVSIQSTSTTKVPTFKLYRGAESPSRFIEGTYTGTFNSTNTDIDLNNGEALVGVFENCDVGASCTVTVEGRVFNRAV